MLVRPKSFIWMKLDPWIFRNMARFFIFMARLYKHLHVSLFYNDNKTPTMSYFHINEARRADWYFRASKKNWNIIARINTVIRDQKTDLISRVRYIKYYPSLLWNKLLLAKFVVNINTIISQCCRVNSSYLQFVSLEHTLTWNIVMLFEHPLRLVFPVKST
jgi:hypothetical protein